MKKLLCILLLITTSAVAAENTPATYYIPPTQFNAAIQIMNLGFANIFGLFRSATGSFVFDENSKSISRLRLAIDAASVMSNNPESQNDLAMLLGVTQFPEISITAPESAAFAEGKASLKGTLTLHGTSKPLTLEATLNRQGKTPQSTGEAIGLSIRASFKRADFGIGDDPNMPSRFGDTITLMLEMQAMRQ
ncbi:MAG: YceI family protein [Alphaproteobacteria bacterium]|nr:YceI family protein [Alphaproteobacteria bacterium]